MDNGKYANFWDDWFVFQEIVEDGKKKTVGFQWFRLLQEYRMVFASIFDSIYFNAEFRKKDIKGNKIPPDIKRIPMQWTTKNKIAQFRQFKEAAERTAIGFVVPMIGIAPTSLDYDPARMHPETPKMQDTEFLNILRANQSRSALRSYIPKPFIQHYSVNILTHELIVQDQILEQVLPQVCPTIQFDINIPLYKKYTTRIKFDGIDVENSFETDYDKDRLLSVALNFSQEIILFPPIKDNEMIESIQMRMNVNISKEPEDWKKLEYDQP